MDTNPPGNQPGFFGQKVSRPGINVNSAGDNELILKDDYTTRTYYDASGNVVLELGQLDNGNYGLASTNGQITVAQDGVIRIIIGLLPDGTYGMAISKPGIDVNSAFS